MMTPDDKVNKIHGAASSSSIVGDESSTTSFTTYGSAARSKTTLSGDEEAARPEYVNPVVAAKEQVAVGRTKLCLIMVLLLAVAVVATTACLLILGEEQEDFESQFQNSASELATVARETASNSMKVLESFSVAISSHANSANLTWPFVSLPDWTVRARNLAELTNSRSVLFAPIVQADVRFKWENFTIENAPAFYEEAIEEEGIPFSVEHFLNITIPTIHGVGRTEDVADLKVSRLPQEMAPFAPMWQTYPLGPYFAHINLNLRSSRTEGIFYLVNETLKPALGFLLTDTAVESQILMPIFDHVYNGKNEEELAMVGVIMTVFEWSSHFQNILTEEANEMQLVLQNSCTDIYDSTYLVQGRNVTFMGPGDKHDRAYDYLEYEAPFFPIDYDENKIPDDICVPEITLHLYPTSVMEESFHTNKAAVYTSVVVLIFAFTTFIFALYDFFVTRRQQLFMERVIKQDKIMSNVFPSAIRDRLYEHNIHADVAGDKDSDLNLVGGEDTELFGAAPLAELYPNATVVYADISGFTAWSSAREPSQVFMLLETIYGAFDKLAYRHGVWKVETVGDCYLAVAGLPEPIEDHAIAAAKFAMDIMHKMKELTYKLEVRLGPDTTDLELRIGINSGQVTAGVLRGERARFQLFGDTVNTAARMESSSIRSRIQISTYTADLLKKHGKARWVTPRRDRVEVKGKGEMQTFWLLSREELARKRKKRPASSSNAVEMAPIQESDDDSSDLADLEHDDFDDDDVISIKSNEERLSKSQRLVEWNVEIMCNLLQQIVAARGAEASQETKPSSLSSLEDNIGSTGTVLEEFQPIINLKRFDAEDLEKRVDPNSINLGGDVKDQLRDYLTTVSGMYRNNSFHNFEHASHVTASVRKLLSRIVSVDDSNKGIQGKNASSNSIDLVDLAGHSYGITSDPLTQFAVVFSAVIHDLDHPGVPNTQLVQEKTRNAQIYKHSIAEQNSVDLAWELLMGPEYGRLRACIYTNKEELKRFRQLVVNTVMATDIADKKLQALRKERWETAFSTDPNQAAGNETPIMAEDRKATIVIEHLIQASDVSHTMQHWHIFKKWNESLFMEMYGAYRAGRAASDPSVGWYKGEIGFFDFYVIPLAKKLENCGVFGVSSDEYLGYAQANREEWAREGEQIVKGYLEKYEQLQK